MKEVKRNNGRVKSMFRKFPLVRRGGRCEGTGLGAEHQLLHPSRELGQPEMGATIWDLGERSAFESPFTFMLISVVRAAARAVVLSARAGAT